MRILSSYILLILVASPTNAHSQGLSEEVRKIENEMNAASTLARDYQVHKKIDKAVHYTLKALDLARTTENNEFIYSQLLKTSSIESDAEFYNRSIKRLIEAEGIDAIPNSRERMNWAYARLFIGMNAPRLALNKLLLFPDSHTSTIAKLYTQIGMPDSAVYYYRVILKIHPKKLHSYNNLGFAYASSNNLDSALYYYHRALKFAKPSDFMFGMINGNIGALYSKNNKYKKAISYLKIDFETSESYKENDIHVNVGELLYRAYSNTGDRATAFVVLENMTSYKNDVNLLSELAILRVELLHFKDKETVQQYDARLKNYENRNNEYLKSIQDKAQATAEVLSGYRIKQIETEKTMLSQELIIQQNEKKRDQLKNGLLILGFSLVTLIILLFFRRYKAKQTRNALLKEAELDSAQKEQEILALKVKEESRTVQVLSLELMMKQDFTKNLLKELDELENVSKSDINSIEIFIQNELELKSIRAQLQDKMGDLSNNFHYELKSSHPNLSNSEIKLAAMIVMKMTNKEIGISKNMSSETVRNAKYRLKKKMQLPNEEDLFEFLSQYLS